MSPEFLALLLKAEQDARKGNRNLFELLETRSLLSTPELRSEQRVKDLEWLVWSLTAGPVTPAVLYGRLDQPVEPTAANLLRGVVDWLEQLIREKP